MNRHSDADAAPPRPQLSPVDWIRAARRLLVSRSVDAVRVEVLAKELGVTRGSFYWHFKDRDDLLQRMLLAWRDEATEQVIARFERSALAPPERIQDLLSLPLRGKAAEEAASTELAIRAWARRDARVRQLLGEVDAQRLAYIARCFLALGLAADEARGRAFALYSYELAESLLPQQGTDADKTARQAVMARLLLAGLAPAAGAQSVSATPLSS